MYEFNRSLLTDYSSRMLDLILPAFPKESIDLIDNSENFFTDDDYRYAGAWVIEWLCPAGGYDWNIRLRSTREGIEEQLTLVWGNDHIHFGYWTNTKPYEEAEDCLTFLNEIFEERIWHVSFYHEERFIQAQMCKSNEIQHIKAAYQATSYKVKSWKGHFDKTIDI
jgi:hypothetical protein